MNAAILVPALVATLAGAPTTGPAKSPDEKPSTSTSAPRAERSELPPVVALAGVHICPAMIQPSPTCDLLYRLSPQPKLELVRNRFTILGKTLCVGAVVPPPRCDLRLFDGAGQPSEDASSLAHNDSRVDVAKEQP